MDTIKDRVYSLAKIRNISIPDLENKCGFGAGTIGKWDKSAPSALKLYEVSVVLETSMEYLLNGYDGMNPKEFLKDAVLRENYADHEEKIKEQLSALLGKTIEEVFGKKEEPTGDQIDSDEFNDMSDDELDSFIRELVSKRGNNFKVKLASGILGSVTNE